MIEIYSTPTANGQKIHIILEELGLAYRAQAVDLAAGAHRTPDMLALNPMGKLPVLVDPEGPDGAPISLGETGAIAFYLAQKTGQLGPETPREAAECAYWSHAISASLATPFAMQFYFTALAPERIDWALDTFTQAALRTLAGFEAHLATRSHMVGERFTIIDALLYPHLVTSAARIGGIGDFPALTAYAARLSERPGLRRGMAVLQPPR